ncbi:Glutamine-dependent NAD(+) synthetase [Bosea thiooxidans]
MSGTPIPPSSFAALAGATVLLNLSASNVTIGKSDWRHALCKAHSGRCIAAYAYSAAGAGESTTDLAWDGQAMIYENGALLAEAERFAEEPQLIFADIDLERLAMDRIRQNTFGDSADANRDRLGFRRVAFALEPDRQTDIGLARAVERFPFVPSDDARLNELCFEAYNIQSHGLRKRLESTRLDKVVIGVSGGLDLTQALIVAAHTFDALGLPRENILAYTLPAFATSKGTKDNAWGPMRALGVSAEEIDMTLACRQMLIDIGHPFAQGQPLYDVTFENVRRRATSVLFRLANRHNALVMGTGDLSELALGGGTYGVGDHMSHYNVNGSVPKTLIQHLIRWVAQSGRFGPEAAAVMLDILATEISPELVPGEGDKPAQKTEDFVGPYALQDFNLYYTTRYGFRPSKIAFLAEHAWRDAAAGTWPPNMEPDKRIAYDLPVIKRWLGVFIRRFFETSQFKRSALPNGPKVSSGGSLSPRGGRAPSDASAAPRLSRRSFLAGSAVGVGALGLAGCAGDGMSLAEAQKLYGPMPNEKFPIPAIDVSKVDPKYYRRTVAYDSKEAPGTIIVDPANYYVYRIEGDETATRYGANVGRDGFRWKGDAYVGRKSEWATWTPPKEMIKRLSPRQPNMPAACLAASTTRSAPVRCISTRTAPTRSTRSMRPSTWN